jgi:hypothetical protein
MSLPPLGRRPAIDWAGHRSAVIVAMSHRIFEETANVAGVDDDISG